MVLVQVHTLHLDGEQYALCKWNPRLPCFLMCLRAKSRERTTMYLVAELENKSVSFFHCKAANLKNVILSQFSSAQSCPTICDPMDCSTPGLPVHHQLLEFTLWKIYQEPSDIYCKRNN